jgi:hypothetical protein
MIYEGKNLDTIGAIFDEAVSIAKYNPYKAKDFLDKYVSHIVEVEGISYDEALDRAKSNLGYFAGYYDKYTCALIYEVYCTEHPVFGKKPYGVSPEDAFKAGLEAGYKYK